MHSMTYGNEKAGANRGGSGSHVTRGWLKRITATT